MNNSTDSRSRIPFTESERDKILKITAYSVMFFLSFIGNSTIIAVIYKNANHRMRTASNLFILNMAVSNLLFILWNVPLSLKSLSNDYKWFAKGTFGLFLCKFCMFWWFFSELVSTGSLSAIAVDRFLLVYYPTRNFLTKRISALTITLSWVIATAFTSPIFVYTNTVQFNNKIYCFMDMGSQENFTLFTTVIFALFIATPLIVVSVLYFAIIMKLLGQKPVGEDVNNHRQERKRKENCRICVMLLVIVFLFALCVLPYWTVYVYCVGNRSSSSVCRSTYYFQIAYLLTCVNAGANPYIYIFFSQAYMNGAKNLFFKVPVHPELMVSVNQTRRTNRASARIARSEV